MQGRWALQLQQDRAVLVAEQLLTLMQPITGHALDRLDRQQHQCQDPHQHFLKAQVVQQKT
jgi:hypothetical protein